MAIETKEITLLAGSEETRRTLSDQLNEILGDFIRVRSYAVDANEVITVHNQLVILSSYLIEEESKPYIGENCSVLVAHRIVNFQNIEKIYSIPKGEKVLYVNDYLETVNEAISSFEKLGIDHLDFIPFYPGKKQKEPVKFAITPGELDLVPSFVEEVINIGPRLIDITTLITILNRLGLLEARQEQVSGKYIKTITQLSKKLGSLSQEATIRTEHLKKVVNGVNDGILAVDCNGKITVFNEILERFLRMPVKKAVNRDIQDVISHKELVQFILNEQEEEDRYFTIEDRSVIVHRFTIEAEETVVVTFKDAEETVEIEKKLRKELLKKGYYAKYSFNDIIGLHPKLQEVKKVANKLARTDLTILIEGESGTGKELFSSSIHNASLRNKGPFLAVNFSALPEDLVESELFGYEEGAFTGAKKGGRKGLFEQANGGTIFLDEIGDISLKVQARLLRVLQEKELLRIGGNKIIPIDVRVIAATNKDLLALIEEGKFREDLYHRLKVLFLHLPELRKRKEDIDLLVQEFINQSGRFHVKIEPQVLYKLKEYQWYGNVRELKNTIDYMLAVCEDDIIRLHDIPDEGFFQQKKAPQLNKGEERYSAPINEPTVDPYFHYEDEQELTTLLKIIDQLQQQGESVSRKKIARETQLQAQPLSEQQVRLRLNKLEQRGYIEKRKGRLGTRLTRLGQKYIQTVY
ncbi:sigma 54-interacting transcriptional regulator [Alkalihalobacterium chitinilyticum]|uniref:Sigma 54-interacting transcriptional regulator n=1 Tax=Alkalihalobacterium chitinilyticum TaxID=2980103 RepID=A0ABT5VIH7_9BACI|nr:sigma 54-interacting transcriptional regulator [Alkalihalobacterium chitinilyticum]MDE5415250.1 sigma 54-interacting transcriptional regulator [Alkalihalobacterium chitinilyticum]